MTYFGRDFFDETTGSISTSTPNVYSVQTVVDLAGITPLPSDKTSVYVEDERAFFHFDAQATDAPTSASPTPGDSVILPSEVSASDPGRWIKTTGSVGSISHSSLLGLSADDHPQYLKADGTRPLSGPWNVGGHPLTGVSELNGVVPESHSSNHVPSGSDALPTGTPQSIGTANQEGISDSFARSDHIHSHGDLPGGTLHSVATPSYNGFMSASDKAKLDTIEVGATVDQLADEVPYTPSVPSDWDGSANNVAAALDEAAHRIRALEPTIEYFDGYDVSGGQTFTGTITVNLDTVRQNSGQFSLDSATGEVTVLKSGKYQIIFTVDLDVSSGTSRSTSEMWLEVSTDGGATFSVITASYASMYNRRSGTGDNSATASVILDLVQNNVIRVRVRRVDGSSTLITKPEGAKLQLLEIRTW